MDFTEFYRELQRIGYVEEEFPSRIAASLYACFDAGLNIEQTRRFMGLFNLIKSVGPFLVSDTGHAAKGLRHRWGGMALVAIGAGFRAMRRRCDAE